MLLFKGGYYASEAFKSPVTRGIKRIKFAQTGVKAVQNTTKDYKAAQSPSIQSS